MGGGAGINNFQIDVFHFLRILNYVVAYLYVNSSKIFEISSFSRLRYSNLKV